MKILKIKLNITIFFIALFFGTSNIVYAGGGLTVEFESTPLFSEINFIPGESVTKYIKVTNTLGEAQTVVVSAINSNSCSKAPCLSEAINLVIKKEGSELFNDSLENFLNGDEINLGNLENGSNAQYDIIATFIPEKKNEYQALSSNFDLLVGFQGGVFVTSGAGGGGGGGNIPRGLTIKDETSILLNLDSVVIQWNTSYLSTSQVIYREEGQSYSLDLSLPNYGYPHGTTENLEKVLDHSVFLNGLEAGKTYYYRAVSHASPATVGLEHSFRMLTKEEIDERLSTEEERYFAGYSGFHEGLSDDSFSPIIKLADGGTLILEDKNNGEITSTTTVSTTSFSASDNLKNVAMAGGFFSDSPWWIWLVILLIIFILVYLFFKVWNTD